MAETLTLILFLTTFFVSAQDTNYEEGKKYILAGLEVTGLQSYNEQTVKTYTGLRDGQQITIPGDEISAIINKLWNLELFSDISFFVTKMISVFYLIHDPLLSCFFLQS